MALITFAAATIPFEASAELGFPTVRVSESRAELADIDEDERMTRDALELLSTKRKNAYDAALGALRGDTRSWWQDHLDTDPDELAEGETTPEPTAAALQCFLEDHVLPVLKKRRERMLAILVRLKEPRAERAATYSVSQKLV